MATQLPPPGSPDTFYLIDLSGYVFRAYHAIEALTNSKGEPTNATYGTLLMLTKLINERKPMFLGVALEGGRSFRGEIDPRYKAHRPPPPPDLAIQVQRCRELADAYRIPALSSEGFEADDVIATLVKQAKAAGMRVVIASADKDMMQLVDDRVVMWDAMRDRVYGPPEVEQKFDVPPSQVRDLLALVGDTSDNIPGVPSVGMKTAAELMKQFGSFEALYARLDEVKKPRIQKALSDNVEDARLSLALVTLRDDAPVRFDKEALRYGGGDVERLRALFTELEFGRQLSALPREVKAKAVEVTAEFRCVLELAELEAFAARVRERGALAIYAHTSDEDAMRCHLTGLGLSAGVDDGLYVPLEHLTLGGPKQLRLSAVLGVIGPLLEDPAIAKLGHDEKRLDVILRRTPAESGGPITLRGVTLDTMLASYLLDPEVDHAIHAVAEREAGVRLPALDSLLPKSKSRQKPTLADVPAPDATRYGASHAEVLFRIAERQREHLTENEVDGLLRDLELPLSHVLADLELGGVLVDLGVLGHLGEVMTKELAALEEKAREVSGHRDLNVGSPRQLETVLFDELGLKSVKRTKTGRSTDAEALEAIADEHPLPGVVLEHRAIAKLKGTYVDALPRLVHPATGRIHGHWRQAVAATGRISSEEPNLQNIPIRTELGREIRKAFIAPPGHVFLSADYSQIELRVLAHLSGDEVMVDAFRSGQDIHTRTAMEVFGVSEGAVTADMRRKSKTINFGVIYGMGDTALGKRLAIPRKEATEFIRAYFERYRGVARFMKETMEEAKKSERVRTMLGRLRILPDLHNTDRMRRAYAERIAANTPIQGTAADILKLAMIKLREPVVPGARMVLTVHDELDFEVPAERAEEATATIKRTMEGVLPLAVPLEVDVGWGRSWAETD